MFRSAARRNALMLATATAVALVVFLPGAGLAGTAATTRTGVVLEGEDCASFVCPTIYIASNGVLLPVSLKKGSTWKLKVGTKVVVSGTLSAREFASVTSLYNARVVSTVKGPATFKMRAHLGKPLFQSKPSFYGAYAVADDGPHGIGMENGPVTELAVPTALRAAAAKAERGRKPVLLTVKNRLGTFTLVSIR